MERIDYQNLRWLTNCPASDINFRCNLKEANIETLEEALKNKSLTKTARKLIESQLKRIKKNGK